MATGEQVTYVLRVQKATAPEEFGGLKIQVLSYIDYIELYRYL